MGVNGQLLMHFAALRGYEWNAYIEAMREGERKYGPVGVGLYGGPRTSHEPGIRRCLQSCAWHHGPQGSR